MIYYLKKNKNQERVPSSPLDESFVLEIYTSKLNLDSSNICAVDDKGFNDGEQIVLFPSCYHFAHVACIKNWQKKNPGTCPRCCKIRATNKPNIQRV